MVHKALLRLLGRARDPRSRAASRAWCSSVAENVDAFATSIDAQLWAESQAFGLRLRDVAESRLPANLFLGGGGHYPLLYFLTRYRVPEVVVETGVAAGFSTRAFLQAIAHNGRGFLYSSDFPYFRLSNPEQFIGILVDDELRPNWQLYVGDDRGNLPQIVRKAPYVDFFHYDSDKSYSGRAFAMDLMQRHMRPDSVIVMDDIQDNLFFRHYVERHGCRYRVFPFEGKYVGVIGI